MCIRTVEADPWVLAHVPNHFKTQEMCNDAGTGDSYLLGFFPEYYVKLQEILYEDFDNDDKLVEWCNNYTTQGLESTNKRRINANWLASHKNAKLVYGRG